MQLGSVIRVVALFTILVLSSSRMTRAWDVTVNGRPMSDADSAMSVAVDPQTGSIFVASRKQITSNDAQFSVTKFTSGGIREWQQTLPGTVPLASESGPMVVVDANGFVIVAGTVGNTASGGDDILIMKIDGRSSRKHVLWVRVADVPSGQKLVSAMVLTPDGGVVIAGALVTSDAQSLYVMRFTDSGQDAWAKPQIISGTASGGPNSANAVAVMHSGDIAVTGMLTNTGSSVDLVVAKFDGSTGARIWMATINDSRSNGNDLGTALSIADNGDLIVGGITQGPGADRANFAVFRFNGSGNLLWQTVISGGFFDAARTVAVAPDGDIIAGGTLDTTSGPNNSTFTVVALNAEGRERWRYQLPGRGDFLQARAITFDRNGNPVATGITEQGVALATFGVVALNKDTGTELWSVPIIGTASLLNQGRAIVSDGTTGAVVTVGVTQNNRTSFDITVSRIIDGYEEWRQIINGRGKRVDRDDGVLAITFDSRRDSVAVAGYAQNTGAGLLGTPQEFRVVKIRKTGVVSWIYDLRDPFPHINNAALAVVSDPSGDFFAAGRTCAGPGGSCFTVVRIRKDGKELWRKILSGPTAALDEARALVRDPQDGNLIAAGRLQTSASISFGLLKIDANTGSVLWSVPDTDIQSVSINSLILTTRGTVAVAGAVQGQFAVLEFDTSTGRAVSRGVLPISGDARSVAFDESEGTLTAAGVRFTDPFDSSMLIAKFKSDGSLAWSKDFDRTMGTPAIVAVDPETGAVSAVSTFFGPNGQSFSALLLFSNGDEGWRTESIPGAAKTIMFLGNRLLVAGQLGPFDSTGAFGVIAFTREGNEEWRRTFRGTADFGLNAAAASVVDTEKGAVYVGGVIADNPTGPDMFVVGLASDGSDLHGVPGQPPLPQAISTVIAPKATDWH